MLIEVDPSAPLPPSEQIVEQVRFAVASERMLPGDRLPSVRKLATSARVNPNTVAKAYRDLEREGTVESRPGSGMFVAARAAAQCRDIRDDTLADRLGRAVRDALAGGLEPHAIRELVDHLLTEAAEEGRP